MKYNSEQNQETAGTLYHTAIDAERVELKRFSKN